MGETSTIEWTDATVNFWWGCTKVGPGCDHCYAESFDKRVGGAHWGTGTPRRKIASAAQTLFKLNRQGDKRVFIQSMSDLFDNEVPIEWFDEAWLHIHTANHCRIQIVTKRISMVEKRLSQIGGSPWPAHAGLMITVVNQAEADRDIPRLLALKAKLGIPWVGLSMEPLLGPVDMTAIHHHKIAANIAVVQNVLTGVNGLGETGPRLDWVIVGGESGPKARPMHPDWARGLRDQCQAAGVPFFFKQWGEWGPLFDRRTAIYDRNDRSTWGSAGCRAFGCAKGVTWIEPDGNRCRAFNKADAVAMEKIGKARAGRLLDGREWNDMPGALTDA